MTNNDRDYDSSPIWRRSRYEAGISQEYMANYIGVSRKTIQNWESGVSAPDFNQGTKWFEALGVNPLPYFLAYVYPEHIEGISPKSDDAKITTALLEIIKDLPIEGQRQLLYLFYGAHGSQPRAVLNLLTAHLQLPISDRVTAAVTTVSDYEMAEATGKLVCPDHIQPDIPDVKAAIEAAKKAAIAGHEGYISNS